MQSHRVTSFLSELKKFTNAQILNLFYHFVLVNKPMPMVKIHALTIIDKGIAIAVYGYIETSRNRLKLSTPKFNGFISF